MVPREPDRDELREELVEVATAGGLGGDLAEGGDRHGVADVDPARDDGSRVVDDDPRSLARRRLECAQESSPRRPGVGSAASTALSAPPSGAKGATAAATPIYDFRRASVLYTLRRDHPLAGL